METLLLDPVFPIQMTPMAPIMKTDMGAGAAELRRRWPIPYYRFTISMGAGLPELSEEQLMFLIYHQGDRPFWFDGVAFGTLTTSRFVDFTDGSRTQYYLPRRNIFAPSWVLDVNGTVITNWTAVESTGLVTFGSAPAAGTLRGKGPSKFKVVLDYDNQDMYDLNEIADKVMEDGKISLREIP